MNFTRQPIPNEAFVLIFRCLGDYPGTNMDRV